MTFDALKKCSSKRLHFFYAVFLTKSAAINRTRLEFLFGTEPAWPAATVYPHLCK